MDRPIRPAAEKIAQEMEMESAQAEPPHLDAILCPAGKEQSDKEAGEQAMGQRMVPTPIGFRACQNRQSVKIRRDSRPRDQPPVTF